jgi:hypothetical protein
MHSWGANRTHDMGIKTLTTSSQIMSPDRQRHRYEDNTKMLLEEI